MRDTGKSTELKPIKMTKVLLTNTRSCYCGDRLHGERENCLNTEYIEEQNTVELQQLTQHSEKLQGASHYLKHAMLNQLLKWPHKVVLLQLLPKL